MSIDMVILTTTKLRKFAILSLSMDKTAMEKLSDWINARLKSKGWSTIQLAENANVSKQVISKYISQPPETPNLEILYRISKAFGTQITEPLIAMGYLNEQDDLNGMLNMLSDEDLNEITQITRLKLSRNKLENKKQTSRSKRPARSALKEK